MADTELDLVISIVTWQAREEVLACLRSFLENAGVGLRYKIYVYDNASEDGTVAAIRSEFPDVEVYEGPRNIGLRGHNENLNRADAARVIIVANSDIAMMRKSLADIVSFIDHQSLPCVVGVKVHRADGSLLPRMLHRRGFPSFTEWLLGRSLARPLWEFARRIPGLGSRTRLVSALHAEDFTTITSPLRVDRVSGCFFALSRDLFSRHGLFDPEYFMYAETIEYLKRLRVTGVPVYFLPDVEIIHGGGVSNRRSTRPLNLLHNRSYSYYYQKHHGKLYAWVMHACLFTDALLRYAIYSLAQNHRVLLKYMTPKSLREDISYFWTAMRHPLRAITPYRPSEDNRPTQTDIRPRDLPSTVFMAEHAQSQSDTDTKSTRPSLGRSADE